MIVIRHRHRLAISRPFDKVHLAIAHHSVVESEDDARVWSRLLLEGALEPSAKHLELCASGLECLRDFVAPRCKFR